MNPHYGDLEFFIAFDIPLFIYKTTQKISFKLWRLWYDNGPKRANHCSISRWVDRVFVTKKDLESSRRANFWYNIFWLTFQSSSHVPESSACQSVVLWPCRVISRTCNSAKSSTNFISLSVNLVTNDLSDFWRTKRFEKLAWINTCARIIIQI